MTPNQCYTTLDTMLCEFEREEKVPQGMVEIYTKSGWSKYVTPNKSLSFIFLPYVELGERYPKRIELCSSVGEVLERDWDKYEAIMSQFTRYLPRVTPGERYKEWNERIYYIDMMEHVNLHASTPFHLTDVASLTLIVDLPDGWETFVYVDDSSSSETITNHILRQGERSPSTTNLTSLRFHSAFHSAVPVLTISSTVLTVLEMKLIVDDESTMGPSLSLLRGHHLNAGLRALSRGRSYISVEDVMWKELYDSLVSVNGDLKCSDNRTLDTFLYLAGVVKEPSSTYTLNSSAIYTGGRVYGDRKQEITGELFAIASLVSKNGEEESVTAPVDSIAGLVLVVNVHTVANWCRYCSENNSDVAVFMEY